MAEVESLFREQVIARHFGRHNSATVIHRARILLAGSLAGALLFIALLWVLLETHYKETVTARGVLEVSGDTQRIVAPVAARLRVMHVTEGQTVRGTGDRDTGS